MAVKPSQLASRSDRVVGYVFGIASGVAYGFNPLFAKPLLSKGVTISTMLFFRYTIAMILMAVWMGMRRQSFSTRPKQTMYLILLGILFTLSSITLFSSYNYIPSGVATTIVYLYPVFTVLIMLFLRHYPSWQVCLSILVTLIGVFLLCWPSEQIHFNARGITLSILSAFIYALYLVIVNRNKTITKVSASCITLYALATGAVIFLVWHLAEGVPFLNGLSSVKDWLYILGLAIFPTIISLVGLAVSTRKIGATKTSVLGAFEPITAILVGTVVFSEPFTANIAVGVILCIAAILFMIVSTRTSASERK